MKNLPCCILAGLMILCLGCTKAQRPVALSSSNAAMGSPAARVLIRSGSLMLRAKDLPATKAEVTSLLASLDGWVDEWSLSKRWLEMSLQVPEPSLDIAMDRLAGLGKVVRRSLRATDVTEEMVDLEARLRTLKALRDRLRAYFEQAVSLQEILSVEQELARVQMEIESIEAKLILLRNKVAMSTLRLTVRRR